MNKKLYYFGCLEGKGHFLYDYGRMSIDARVLQNNSEEDNVSFLQCLDGIYTPGKNQIQGLYQETNIGKYKIVAWWDRSLDQRYGSNSALIGYGYNTSEEMINDYFKKFPSVAERQPRPIKVN